MNEQINRLASEFIPELSKASQDDYLQIKLMMLSVVRHKAVDAFLHKVFSWQKKEDPCCWRYREVTPYNHIPYHINRR